MNDEQDTWVTAEELSAEIKVPVATLYTWRKHRRGPVAVRMGRELRYARSDINAWIAAQRALQGDR